MSPHAMAYLGASEQSRSIRSVNLVRGKLTTQLSQQKVATRSQSTKKVTQNTPGADESIFKAVGHQTKAATSKIKYKEYKFSIGD